MASRIDRDWQAQPDALGSLSSGIRTIGKLPP
jgi:hypothetical protein